jgi:hypothetical protein
VNFPLKPMSKSGIPAALLKAERYRLLNDPEPAESICHDILAVDPENQAALKSLLLTLSDQFASEHSQSRAKEARDCAARLESEYERAYYTGVVFEREARALLARSMLARRNAYGVFRHAMDWYAKAEALRTPGNDDAILRWNSCVRTLEREKLEPEAAERDLPLE